MKLSVSQLIIIIVLCILAAIIIIILSQPQPTVPVSKIETQVEETVTLPEPGKYELPPKQETPQQKITKEKLRGVDAAPVAAVEKTAQSKKEAKNNIKGSAAQTGQTSASQTGQTPAAQNEPNEAGKYLSPEQLRDLTSKGVIMN